MTSKAEQKLPCSCYASVDRDGYMWIEAEGFLCEAQHKQGDLVEVRAGLARVQGFDYKAEVERVRDSERYADVW